MPSSDPRMAEAAAAGDAEVVMALLEADPTVANRRVGTRLWPPLLYVSWGRDPHAETDRVRIARRLLELGADVNAAGDVPGWTAGNVTQMFDEHRWLPIEAAAGRLASAAMVRLLLDAGADLTRTEQALTQAVAGGSIEVVRALLDVAPRSWWQVRWALKACAVVDRADMARLIVAATANDDLSQVGADRALHEALRLERGVELIEALLGRERDEVTPRATYRLAVRYGRPDVAQLLLGRGAQEGAASPLDRAIGACIRGSPLISGVSGFADEDHRMLAWAVRRGHREAVARLLALGLDPNVADLDGETPLHLAVRTGDSELVDVLLRAGADPGVKNFEGATPMQQDRPIEHDTLDALFEQAADAVAFGNVERLRQLLDQEPRLAHARSPRPHRATLLHYCAANGTEDPRQRCPSSTPQVAQLLLERGADPNATCNLYGGGATTMGLLLTSAHPRAAGLDGELIRVLARFGTRLDGAHLVLAIEHDCERAASALVDSGVAVDTPFTAAGMGDVGALERLLDAGADINGRYAPGSGTPLHAAAAMAQTRAVRVLLERGADTTLRNGWSSLPAGTARYFGHTEVAELIDGFQAGQG